MFGVLVKELTGTLLAKRAKKCDWSRIEKNEEKMVDVYLSSYTPYNFVFGSHFSPNSEYLYFPKIIGQFLQPLQNQL